MSSPIPPKGATPLFTYPSKASPFFIVWKDKPRRVSTCQACREPIKKQTDRIIFQVHTSGRNYKNGGRTSIQRFFMHPACGGRLLAELRQPDDPLEKCWDCGKALTSESGSAVPVCVGSRSSWANLCLDCGSTPRWRKCDSCGVMFTKCQTSVLVVAPEWWTKAIGQPSFVCDYCADSDGLITAKDVKRIERADRAFNQRYDSIINSIINGEMFRGGS